MNQVRNEDKLRLVVATLCLFGLIVYGRVVDFISDEYSVMAIGLVPILLVIYIWMVLTVNIKLYLKLVLLLFAMSYFGVVVFGFMTVDVSNFYLE